MNVILAFDCITYSEKLLVRKIAFNTRSFWKIVVDNEAKTRYRRQYVDEFHETATQAASISRNSRNLIAPDLLQCHSMTNCPFEVSSIAESLSTNVLFPNQVSTTGQFSAKVE